MYHCLYLTPCTLQLTPTSQGLHERQLSKASLNFRHSALQDTSEKLRLYSSTITNYGYTNK